MVDCCVILIRGINVYIDVFCIRYSMGVSVNVDIYIYIFVVFVRRLRIAVGVSRFVCCW